MGRSQPVTALTDIEEFRLVRMLGRGGMGTVYLAHDSILDRPVALKIVTGVSQDSRLRFLTEARAIARLHHPNVVAIHRAGTTADGEPYLIQELIRGQSLDRLARPVPPERCLALATGIARGLAAAHRRGVLHRDVKPSNVMLDDLGTPRLLDFGIAKLSGAPEVARTAVTAVTAVIAPPAPVRPATGPLDETAELPGDGALAADAAVSPDAPAAPRTCAGTLLGTPCYMAPEMWRGEPATARSDLYALGVVMYELLAGAPPFTEADPGALRDAVLRGAPTPIGERVSGLDPGFAQLIMRCLAGEPAARPESADEVVDQLERIATGAAAIPEGNPYRGLAPFEAEQRAVFFGRGSEVAAIVDRLRSESFVVVTGDSGIGKSSLCRAGVLPAIAASALADGRAWTVRSVVLGRRPAASLRELLHAPSLDHEPEPSLTPQISRELALGGDRGLLVFIDQLEELVTQAEPAEASWAAAILAMLGDGIPGVKVLVAVRGDFLTRVAALPTLRGVMTRSLHLVRGLSADDAREVVAAPARLKGVAFETRDMVETLARVIVRRPAALPLLSFALSELWARRDPDRAIIPARALDEIGGVVGALASHADRVVTSLAAPERAAARSILLALVTADGTRASRGRAELVGDDPTCARALEALVSGRLVAARDVADGEPVYELAHESLLAAWGTLRGWLDDAAGQRGVRTRLQAAAAEWARLDRPRELLWRRAQLAEVTQLARSGHVAPAEQRFLAASRRAARVRRALAVAIVAAIPAAAGATWLGLAIRDDARRADDVAERIAVAARLVDSADAKVREAGDKRAAAIALFDRDNRDHRDGAVARLADQPWLRALSMFSIADMALPGVASLSLFDAVQAALPIVAEARWSEADEVLGAARGELRDASARLEATLIAGGNLPRVRSAMSDVLYRQALIAEQLRDRPALAELEQRLDLYDDGTYRARLQPRIAVTVTAATATALEIRRYVDRAGLFVPSERVSSVAGDRITADLALGSYVAYARAPQIEPVVLPFVVERDSPAAFDIALPRPGQVPAGMVYIPPGAFLIGSTERPSFRQIYQHAPPLHRATTGAYLIARTEVTFAEYMAFLRAVPADVRDAHRQNQPPRAQTSVRLERDGDTFTLVLQPTSVAYRAPEGQPLVYQNRARRAEIAWEQLPASGVSYDDAVAYAAWLADTGRVPHARLCSETEWERAARGADARSFPHGDALAQDDANFDQTYWKLEGGYGPDPVGSHPASTSPFGVVDLAGNAFEWVQAARPRVRGGSWLQGPTTVDIANHSDKNGTAHDAYLGIRICADLYTRTP
jgi:serine/threonine protein kinase/formylglycine-generating enzyme required for sulfatase activity